MMPLIPVASTSTGHAEPSVFPSARAPRTQRTRHAGTESDSAPAPVVRKRDPKHSPKTVPSRAAMRLLAALDRPRRGSELSALLGVSRERVRQLIGQLADMGLVRSANPGRRTTVVARHDDPTLLLAREQARVLNRFMEAEAATVSQITMHIGMRVAMVGAVVESLCALGMVERTGATRQGTLYRLTPAGLSHWQRSPKNIRRAKAPSLWTRGDRISNALLYIHDHEPVGTVEMRKALNLSPDALNCMLQYLKRVGMVRNAAETWPVPYTLTLDGRQTVMAMRGLPAQADAAQAD